MIPMLYEPELKVVHLNGLHVTLYFPGTGRCSRNVWLGVAFLGKVSGLS